jgi:4a-hydroxytetrahydrobiopterin dehydratase
MKRLDESEVGRRLEGTYWERDGDSIKREFERADFADAIAFVDRVAELAEAANHHPDILVHAYKKVRLTLSTHAADGLTARDFELAAQIDAAS